MAEKSYEGPSQSEEQKQVITDPEFAMAEIGNFLENGIHSVSRAPFTIEMLIEALGSDKDSPMIKPGALAEAMRRLRILGILGYHEDTDEYYLKNLA